MATQPTIPQIYRPAIVLLSGGIDSALCLKIYANRQTRAVGFNYDQPHKLELNFAKSFAEKNNVRFTELKLTFPLKYEEESCPIFGCRNALFLTFAGAYASLKDIDTIVIGSNKSDYERFPDCRPEFFDKMREVFTLANYNINIETPLINLTKKDIIENAINLGINLDDTWSCYKPTSKKPCGRCLACETRNNAIKELS